MSSDDPRDRRLQPRVLRRLPVRLGTEGRMCGGVALDISEGGLRVVAAESFTIHAILDVLVQFPGHAVRLRARVMWTGGGGASGGGPVMGLAFTGPEPSLAGAYKRWLGEVRQAVAEGPLPGSGGSLPAADPATVPSSTPQPPPAEPKGPVRRRLESPQGQSYDALLEPRALGWRLTITQFPHQAGVSAPDHQGDYPDYATAESAMRAFVRAH